MKILDEFKKFIARGNVIDMAVGIAVGSAFTAIAKSLVDDVIMPPIGLFLSGEAVKNLFLVLEAGDPAPPYASLAEAQAAGAVTVNYGIFINAVISFLIIAAVIFLLVRTINRLREKEDPKPSQPTEKECPFCFFKVPVKATRCAHCTSALGS